MEDEIPRFLLNVVETFLSSVEVSFFGFIIISEPLYAITQIHSNSTIPHDTNVYNYLDICLEAVLISCCGNASWLAAVVNIYTLLGPLLPFTVKFLI